MCIRDRFNTDALTSNRIITVPDQSLTLVGEDSTQTLSNKGIVNLILVDNIDATKRVTFSTANQNTATNRTFQFPPTANLNTTITDNNLIVTELATQTVSNKTFIQPSVKDSTLATTTITFRTDNISADREIRFPDADATLLSTENTTLTDVNFGAGIGAANLTGRTRQQQFFFAGQ